MGFGRGYGFYSSSDEENGSSHGQAGPTQVSNETDTRNQCRPSSAIVTHARDGSPNANKNHGTTHLAPDRSSAEEKESSHQSGSDDYESDFSDQSSSQKSETDESATEQSGSSNDSGSEKSENEVSDQSSSKESVRKESSSKETDREKCIASSGSTTGKSKRLNTQSKDLSHQDQPKEEMREVQFKGKKKSRNLAHHTSLMNLYPKSLSLIGLLWIDEKGKECSKHEPVRREPVSGRLSTRVLRRSASLADFKEQLQKSWPNLATPDTDGGRHTLSRAVYEAWYFHKKEEAAAAKLRAQTASTVKKKYKLGEPTVPRQRRPVSCGERVKTRLDSEDASWEWYLQKRRAISRERRTRQQLEAEKKAEKQKQKLQQQEEAALAFEAWKHVKEKEFAKQRKKEKEAAEEARQQAENRAAEMASALSEQAAAARRRDEAAARRLAAEERRRHERTRQERTRQMVLERDTAAAARYKLWLVQSAARRPDSEAATEQQRSRQPWYPGGSENSARRTDLFTLTTVNTGKDSTSSYSSSSGHSCNKHANARSQSLRQSRQAKRISFEVQGGWQGCGKSGCISCETSQRTSAVRDDNGSLLPLRQPLTCSSQRAVFLVQCRICDWRQVCWTGSSIRTGFRHVLEKGRGHRCADGDWRQPERGDLWVTGVCSLPPGTPLVAIRDHAHAVKLILENGAGD